MFAHALKFDMVSGTTALASGSCRGIGGLPFSRRRARQGKGRPRLVRGRPWWRRAQHALPCRRGRLGEHTGQPPPMLDVPKRDSVGRSRSAIEWGWRSKDFPPLNGCETGSYRCAAGGRTKSSGKALPENHGIDLWRSASGSSKTSPQEALNASSRLSSSASRPFDNN